MRVLTVTSLYPGRAAPNHGVFVENRMRRVRETGEAEIRVIAPVPWFPSASPRFGRYAGFAAAPEREARHGITIDHPRYLMIPRIGMERQPGAYFRSLERRVRAIIDAEGPFDLIDAHYFYPDGVAAARLAEVLDLPLVITARGSDINEIPFVSPTARRLILRAADRADRIVTVCQALKDALVDLRVDGRKIVPLRNGVDLETFRPPADRLATRGNWGVSAEERLIVSVGGLVERKGHHLTIAAMAGLPGMRLMIAGDGPERAALELLIDRLGLRERVKLLGAVPHDDLAGLYGAADASVLSSSREGWANVLLEAMACGTPVAATAIWGTPEVVARPAAGRLIQTRDADAIREGIAALIARPPDRAATRAYAEAFSWDDTIAGVLRVFREAIASRGVEPCLGCRVQ